jgi:hypothetical protein
VVKTRPADVPEGDVWLTLLFIFILRILFAKESRKWALIEKKAINWLNKNGIDIKIYE